jgi:hypothetical protein
MLNGHFGVLCSIAGQTSQIGPQKWLHNQIVVGGAPKTEERNSF